eukprot:GFYU01007338.1.p1 GENE.GFYU01007338.1~~GFYU01007338.1.p1  ORF type:complete len:152 (-),score=34.06 GFYU01007338.1:36-491(-)
MGVGGMGVGGGMNGMGGIGGIGGIGGVGGVGDRVASPRGIVASPRRIGGYGGNASPRGAGGYSAINASPRTRVYDTNASPRTRVYDTNAMSPSTPTGGAKPRGVSFSSEDGPPSGLLQNLNPKDDFLASCNCPEFQRNRTCTHFPRFQPTS